MSLIAKFREIFIKKRDKEEKEQILFEQKLMFIDKVSMKMLDVIGVENYKREEVRVDKENMEYAALIVELNELVQTVAMSMRFVRARALYNQFAERDISKGSIDKASQMVDNLLMCKCVEFYNDNGVDLSWNNNKFVPKQELSASELVMLDIVNRILSVNAQLIERRDCDAIQLCKQIKFKSWIDSPNELMLDQ